MFEPRLGPQPPRGKQPIPPHSRAIFPHLGSWGLLRHIRAISELAGMRYWSTTYKQWQTLGAMFQRGVQAGSSRDRSGHGGNAPSQTVGNARTWSLSVAKDRDFRHIFAYHCFRNDRRTFRAAPSLGGQVQEMRLHSHLPGYRSPN